MQGLQTWDANGVEQINTTRFVGRFIATIDASSASGSATVPGLSGGIPFAVPLMAQDPNDEIYAFGYLTAPRCTFYGDTVSWVRESPPIGFSLRPCSLLLGIR
jgi:hypothetical protein